MDKSTGRVFTKVADGARKEHNLLFAPLTIGFGPFQIHDNGESTME